MCIAKSEPGIPVRLSDQSLGCYRLQATISTGIFCTETQLPRLDHHGTEQFKVRLLFFFCIKTLGQTFLSLMLHTLHSATHLMTNAVTACTVMHPWSDEVPKVTDKQRNERIHSRMFTDLGKIYVILPTGVFVFSTGTLFSCILILPLRESDRSGFHPLPLYLVSYTG